MDPAKLYNPLMEMSDPRGMHPDHHGPPFLKKKSKSLFYILFVQHLLQLTFSCCFFFNQISESINHHNIWSRIWKKKINWIWISYWKHILHACALFSWLIIRHLPTCGTARYHLEPRRRRRHGYRMKHVHKLIRDFIVPMMILTWTSYTHIHIYI